MTEVHFASIVLAAGKGTRMKSRRPKVLHELAGRSMLHHVLDCLVEAGAVETVVVTAPDQEEVRDHADRHPLATRNAIQEQQLGTADAVKAALPHVASRDLPVIVLYADTPLLQPRTVLDVVAGTNDQSEITVLGFRAADPTGYGRLLHDTTGRLEAIREEADASPAEKAVDLCNSGVMAFRSVDALKLLGSIHNDNAKGEYYLTDIVELTNAAGLAVSVSECSEEEVMGINSRAQLAEAEALIQNRLRHKAMDGGVTLKAPGTVFLSIDTEFGEDVTIEPHVVIGPGVEIASGAVIRAFSHLEQAKVAENATVGPYARLRPGAQIGEGARIGNFVEVKNARIEQGAKVNHLTYIGDARVGQGANIGAGTITCNYDGAAKHFTDIGAQAFIGSNSSLVAPVSIGDGAYVGSGSVITKDVEAGALAVSRARQLAKEGWAARKAKKTS